FTIRFRTHNSAQSAPALSFLHAPTTCDGSMEPGYVFFPRDACPLVGGEGAGRESRPPRRPPAQAQVQTAPMAGTSRRRKAHTGDVRHARAAGAFRDRPVGCDGIAYAAVGSPTCCTAASGGGCA